MLNKICYNIIVSRKEVAAMEKKLMRIGDINLSKKAEFCSNPSGTPCPKTCPFAVEHGRCKLVEKQYENEMIEVEVDD